jgi:hypothetical protein
LLVKVAFAASSSALSHLNSIVSADDWRDTYKVYNFQSVRYL